MKILKIIQVIFTISYQGERGRLIEKATASNLDSPRGHAMCFSFSSVGDSRLKHYLDENIS
jgi:hypothetical protein